MSLLTLVLALGLGAESTPPKDLMIAEGTFRFVEISKELREFLPNHVAQRITRPGIKVVTSTDMANILGMERQRELLGCSESSGCTAELIGALGADGLLVGEIAKVGPVVQVNLKIVSGRSAETIASFARRVEDERKLLEALDEGADSLAGQLLATRVEQKGARVLGAGFWIPASLAVIGLAGAGVGLGIAASEQTELLADRTAPLSYAAARAHVDTGNTAQTIGFVSLGVGVAAAIGASIAFAVSPRAPVVAVAIGPDSAGLAIGGTFP